MFAFGPWRVPFTGLLSIACSASFFFLYNPAQPVQRWNHEKLSGKPTRWDSVESLGFHSDWYLLKAGDGPLSTKRLSASEKPGWEGGKLSLSNPSPAAPAGGVEQSFREGHQMYKAPPSPQEWEGAVRIRTVSGPPLPDNAGWWLSTSMLELQHPGLKSWCCYLVTR